MAHKNHDEFDESIFKRLCGEALASLPVDARSEEAVLEHLLLKVRNFCGSETIKIRDYTDVPRSLQLRQEIIDVVDHDSVVEHPSSVFFRKEPIIDEYVQSAIVNSGKN